MTAEISSCQSIKECSDINKQTGKWFSFYDQALKVELDDGRRFITNFRYSLKEYVASDPLAKGAKFLSQSKI